ncbi:hypothetical protein SLEP1_g43078 [Rubroshorea leprosula]|uniref:Uncharacterized protein n=1 Tax=Rubroshorea leprosula TaxID=152421 RepID=A0AAV5LCK6_9ROSI|nr:hypothetical protein SLEP1_g43078 [Rubroshorea leprosula]
MDSHTQPSTHMALLEFSARTQRLNEGAISYLHQLTEDNEHLHKANEQLEEQLQDMTINRDFYKIAMEDMCYQLQVEKQKNQALIEEDTGLHEMETPMWESIWNFKGETHGKGLLIIAPRRKFFKKRRSPYLLRFRVIKMSEENAATNPEKSAVDERVDKLEATMQTMAATLQTISLTLSTLTTSSVSSPAIPVPPIPTITPVGESSSHAPQISSLPFEASYPPFEMNDPTLPTTTPLTLNVPPLMGQVPAIQPNPSVAMLRSTLEDGKSREVDHKLQQLEDALKAMQGPQAYGSIDLDDLCYYPRIQTNFKFKQPDFDKYDGSGCPYAHLQMYARKMAPYANDERVLIHYFQDNLFGLASVWFSTLDKKKIHTFKDVSQAFMKQYEYNTSLAPTRDSLQRITKKGNETFKEFAQRWRSEAAKVIPPLTDSEICSLFIKSTIGTFRAWLASCVGYTFAQLVTVGEQIEDGLKTGMIIYFQTIQRQLEQVKMGSSGSTSKRFSPKGKKEDEEALNHIFTSHAKPVYNVANGPYNRQQFPPTNQPRQFTKLPIPYSEVLKQLVEVGLIRTLQVNPIQPPYPYWYDAQARCEYHNVTGHGTENCATLRHRIQDLIDEGKLQLDVKEAKGVPNITQNPLPPHDAGTMNRITFNGPIAQRSLNVLPMMIDDAVICPYHSNMKEHALQDCKDFQRKIKELQVMGILRFTSTQESYVLKTSLSESLMGKTSSVVMPQHSTILNSTANDVSNMTRSGWCYVSLEVEESRRVALKSKGIRIEEMPEELPKKFVSENEVVEFLNILRKSEYSIIEQLNKTLAKISVLELMLSSEVHLDALLKVLKEAHVPKNIDTQKFGTVVGAILAPNYINFTDDEIPDQGNGHTKALHILVQCKMMNVPHVLINNGSALNVIPMIVLKQLKVNESHINQCNTVVRAFDGTKRNVIGKIKLPVEIGPVTFDVDFFVMDISPAFNLLLGRPWIHVAEAVPSTLHQKVKYIVNGVLVTMNGEEEHVIRKATTIPYLGVDPRTYESSYHSMECAAASYIHLRFKGKRVEMAKPTKVVAKIMLACHYQLGEGLGLNGQGILEPIEVIQAWGIFGLGYKLKKEDWQRMHAIKAKKRLARLQGRDPKDEPMWVPHIRVTFPRLVEILCLSFDGYMVKHMDVLYVDPEGTIFTDRLLEIGECSKQAKYEEVVVEDITDEVCSNDEEDSFGFNNLFGPTNMTDPKERWRRMLAKKAFMEKHPNFHLAHHAKAPMGTHESILLETVKEESLCDSWENLTINALDEEELEFDRGISLINGSSQANWTAELLPATFISEPAYDESLNNDVISNFIYEIDDQTYSEIDNENFDPSHELTQMLREEKPKLQPNQETETINLGTEDDRKEIKINAHLSTEERKELTELLSEFQDVFAWSCKDMPGLDPAIAVHAIPLYSEAKPIKQKLRRMKPEVLLKVKEKVQKLLDVNFIEVAIDLNKASPKDDFPLPHIQILLDNAAKNAQFSFVDGYSGYNQIKMKEEDKLKTTFITQWGTFCYKVMPFGLKNAGATYQRSGITLLHDFVHTIVELYVDDMVIMSKEELLGFIVNRRGIEIDPAKIKAIDEMPPPKTQKEVRGFLGRINYIARFIANLTTICEPIFKLLRKDNPHTWNAQCQQAFDKIKEYLKTPPILVPPTDRKPFILYITVLEKSMGAVLVQHDDSGKKERAIYYWRQNLIQIIGSFSLMELSTSLVVALELCCYTLASMIQISNDDVIKPLRIDISQELAHCMEVKVDDKPWFHDIKQFLRNGEYLLHASEVNKKTIRKLATSYFLSGNTLYKRSVDMTLLRCVDETKAKQVMTEVHEGICGTHANGRMLARKILRAGYYWLTMEHDCIKYARACHKCQICANHVNAPPSLLHNMSAPWPFSMWGIDMIGVINPKASNGHQFILVAIDYFTKWVEATSYASVTKKVVTRFIKKEIICRYGQPEAIITDNASNLNNDMMSALCKQFKIKHLNSSPYRPKMNGAVEAANKNIKKILAKMTVTYKDWHEMLP